LFFFIWVPACVLGPIFMLVGVTRLFRQKRYRQQPPATTNSKDI
jgi:hypothetical protein